MKNEQESEVLDLGDEEELLKWAEDDVYYQPLPKEFEVDEEQVHPALLMTINYIYPPDARPAC